MESNTLSVHLLTGTINNNFKLETQGGDTQAEEMKNIRRARLRRMVNADPSLAGKLVALETSPVYNANGSLIQSVGGQLGTV